MKTIKGLKYSGEIFDNYLYRARLRFKLDNDEIAIDIYTTDIDKDNVVRVQAPHVNKEALFLGVMDWCSREQDEEVEALVNKWVREEETNRTGE